MMDKNKLNTEVQRATRAKLLLDEPLFVEAFALLKDEYQSAMFQTKHDDDAVRKALWQAYHITDKVANTPTLSGSVTFNERRLLWLITKQLT